MRTFANRAQRIARSLPSWESAKRHRRYVSTVSKKKIRTITTDAVPSIPSAGESMSLRHCEPVGVQGVSAQRRALFDAPRATAARMRRGFLDAAHNTQSGSGFLTCSTVTQIAGCRQFALVVLRRRSVDPRPSIAHERIADSVKNLSDSCMGNVRFLQTSASTAMPAKVRRLPLDELLYISPRRAGLLCDGLHQRHIYQAIREGKLIARQCGGRSLISVEALRAWFDSLPKTQSSKQKE
jgi:hypothetical protein